jgi:superfamily II DNA/RNA helicase
MSFSDLGVSDVLVQALASVGILEPMPIQSVAIPALSAGSDAYVSAETGMGKTLAYLLPILQQIDPAISETQSIILAPTHELASQIQQECIRLAQNSGLAIKPLLLIGGANPKRQIEKLKKKPRIVIGSCGRILELARMKKLKLGKIRSVVVDEADRMLSGELHDGIGELNRLIPSSPQWIFVSATGQKNGLAKAEELAPGLEHLSVGTNKINPDIHHLFFKTDLRDKVDLLRKLLRATEPERAIVFVHRGKDAEQLNDKMKHYGFPVADIHGAHGKIERKRAMDDFRSGKAVVLIASDVAARGLDIRDVTHIFNYDAPSDSMDYLHRAGRTGRAGSMGYAISLITDRETRLVPRYESELNIKFIEAYLREGQILAVEG